MIQRLRHLSIACLLALGTAGLVPGAPLLSITGPLASSSGLGMTNFNTAQSAAGEAFALAIGFTNVSITVSLGVFEDDPVPLTAWLTNQIGAGTTAANVLFTTTGTPLLSGNYTPFSGLSLTPGTYFLVLAAVQQFNNVGWDWTETPAVTTAPGVTFLGYFANPGNTNDSWNVLPPSYTDLGPLLSDNPFLIQISGDPVPEPQTLVLAGMGIALLLSAGFAKSASRLRGPRLRSFSIYLFRRKLAAKRRAQEWQTSCPPASAGERQASSNWPGEQA